MNSVAFEKKNGKLFAIATENNRDININSDKANELMKALLSAPGKISNVLYYFNNVSFKLDDVKIILKNKDDFKEDRIYKRLNQRKYKLYKEAAIISLASAIMFTGTMSIKASSKANKANDAITPVVTYQDNAEDNTNSNNYNTNILDYGSEVAKDDVLDVGSECNSEKAEGTKEKYKNIIDKYSSIYGLDSNIILAIATQERGVHSSNVDHGGAIGLMQIQVSVWDGQYIVAYNYDNDQYEKINISLDKLRDIDFNIKVGCAIYQSYLKVMNGNNYLATQCYNMGPTTMNKVLNDCSLATGKSIDEIKNDTDNLEWVKYIKEDYAGDPNYAQHVFRYYNNDTIYKK